MYEHEYEDGFDDTVDALLRPILPAAQSSSATLRWLICIVAMGNSANLAWPPKMPG